MDIEIIEFIKASQSPEMAEVYEKSFELLTKFNVEDFILPFDQIYARVDDQDLEFTLQQMHDVLTASLLQVINQHGIFLTDEASPVFMIKVLEGINGIEYYEDTSTVYDILSTEYSDEEKLSDILGLVLSTESEVFLGEITHINPGLVRQIKRIYSERKEAQNVALTDTAALIKEKANWVQKLYTIKDPAFALCKESKLYPMLIDGLRFNLGFQFYWDLLWEDITELNTAELARDLVGMCVISNDASEKALETIKTYVGKNMSDLDQIGKIIDHATRQFLASKQDNGVTQIKGNL